MRCQPPPAPPPSSQSDRRPIREDEHPQGIRGAHHEVEADQGDEHQGEGADANRVMAHPVECFKVEWTSREREPGLEHDAEIR